MVGADPLRSTHYVKEVRVQIPAHKSTVRHPYQTPKRNAV